MTQDQWTRRKASAVDALTADRRRATADQCADCWQDANPNDYAPTMARYGTCAGCGADALVIRVPRSTVGPDDAGVETFGPDAYHEMPEWLDVGGEA